MDINLLLDLNRLIKLKKILERYKIDHLIEVFTDMHKKCTSKEVKIVRGKKSGNHILQINIGGKMCCYILYSIGFDRINIIKSETVNEYKMYFYILNVILIIITGYLGKNYITFVNSPYMEQLYDMNKEKIRKIYQYKVNEKTIDQFCVDIGPLPVVVDASKGMKSGIKRLLDTKNKDQKPTSSVPPEWIKKKYVIETIHYVTNKLKPSDWTDIIAQLYAKQECNRDNVIKMMSTL